MLGNKVLQISYTLYLVLKMLRDQHFTKTKKKFSILDFKTATKITKLIDKCPPPYFKLLCFAVHPASQCNIHFTYPAHLMSQIIYDGQYKYDDLHYPFLTPPLPYVVTGPNTSIPSKNHNFCHSNTLYVKIHTANEELEC
jgi:hypothetical protein